MTIFGISGVFNTQTIQSIKDYQIRYEGFPRQKDVDLTSSRQNNVVLTLNKGHVQT